MLNGYIQGSINIIIGALISYCCAMLLVYYMDKNLCTRYEDMALKLWGTRGA